MPWLGPEWDEWVTGLMLQYMERLESGDSMSQAMEHVNPGSPSGPMLDRMAKAMGVPPQRLADGWRDMTHAQRLSRVRHELRCFKVRRGYVT